MYGECVFFWQENIQVRWLYLISISLCRNVWMCVVVGPVTWPRRCPPPSSHPYTAPPHRGRSWPCPHSTTPHDTRENVSEHRL